MTSSTPRQRKHVALIDANSSQTLNTQGDVASETDGFIVSVREFRAYDAGASTVPATVGLPGFARVAATRLAQSSRTTDAECGG
jgi:hypothetical protein